MATAIASRSAAAFIPARIQSSAEFTQTLMSLQRATHLIASTLDFDALLDRVVNDIACSIGNVEVAVYLRAEDADEMVLQGVKGCTKYCKGERLRIGEQGMVGHVAATGNMRYAPDVRLDPYYIGCEPATRSEVTIPLKSAGQVMGVLSIDHRQTDAFSKDQLKVLEAIAGHIAIAIENARVLRSEREQRRLLEQESADARAIQEALFLKPVPLIPGFAIETAWHPAGSVAGDWFDFIDLGHDRYGIALADVSGKGMPAALLMSATRALLRSIAPQHASPSQTLEHLNRALLEDFPSGKFVTMIYGVLDAPSRQFAVSSAGHLPPLIVNHETAFLEVDTGLPLGLAPSPYPERTVALTADTHILLYTDGITEAENESGAEAFGEARLLEHFLAPDACVEALINKVKSFAGGCARMDDATAVLLRSR
jgi:sigma-B regulation protein RsbU (phosphoserine phosphatase)